MATVRIAPPQYEELRVKIEDVLGPTRLPLLIAIDGAGGAGKSSLASWIAWQFGMVAIHLDLYCVKGSDPLQWRSQELARVIAARLDLKRPLVVEGILLLDALASVSRKPDFLIFVENETYEGGLRDRVVPYVERTQSREKADFLLRWAEPI